MREAVPFKVAANLGCLGELNDGVGGLGQVGKFITIYPEDDAQAVRLAEELDRALVGLPGPRIPSDRPLHPESLVHYRYGGFRDLAFTDDLGQSVPAIRDPDGNLVADRRPPAFEPPTWASDPFEAAGLMRRAPEPTSPLFAGRFLILSVLHQAAKGGVYLALDSEAKPPRVCVLKEGRRHLGVEHSGSDVQDRLRHQYHLMRQLRDDPAFPEAYDLLDSESNAYLAMEYVEGESLQSLVAAKQLRGYLSSSEEVAALGSGIADALARLHQCGWILRDLTPSNIIVSDTGRVHLIDLELAHELGDPSRPYGWGTLGYVSPQQASRRPPAVADDVYAFGATLYFLGTGSQSAFVGDEGHGLQRALELLNPGLSPHIVRLVTDCLDPKPANRPRDMGAIAARLAGYAHATVDPMDRPQTGKPPEGERSRGYLALARGLGDSLLAAAERGTQGVCWASTGMSGDRYAGARHLTPKRSHSPDLHNGVAGIALFLAELGAVSGDERYIVAADDAGRWLTDHCRSRSAMLPGLHFGAAGVAAALCQLAEVTGNAEHLLAASNIAMRASPAQTNIPDLTHGWAGIGMMHLGLALATRDARHMELARVAGEQLAAHSERIGPGMGWRQPPGIHVGMSGEVLTGFAHGAAGIGYFLLELWRATENPRYYRLALAASDWLGSCAEPCLADGSGLNWPLAGERSEDSNRWFYWCHGAAGISLFFLRAWALTGIPEQRRLAEAAARTIAIAGRRGGGALCHGLPGNGSVLLRAYQVLHEAHWLDAAFTFADLLALYVRRDETGSVVPAEHPSVVTPDCMVGYSGTGIFLLRLAEPDRPWNPLNVPIL